MNIPAPASAQQGIAGLKARIEPAKRCCGYPVAVIGEGDAPKLACPNCGTTRGSISAPTAQIISSIVEKFGRPEAPIVFRRKAG